MLAAVSRPHSSPTVQRHCVCISRHGKQRRVACSAEIDDQEERLAALEDVARKGKKFQPMKAAMGQNEGEGETPGVVWKERAVFPEGFDKMDPLEKAGQLWSGERGLLFWLNKAAYASVYIVVGGWILFRFVGPAIGLYELSNALPTGS